MADRWNCARCRKREGIGTGALVALNPLTSCEASDPPVPEGNGGVCSQWNEYQTVAEGWALVLGPLAWKGFDLVFHKEQRL